MNHLLKFKKLHNRYFLMRHGESKANVANLIVSNPDIGISDYGLTEKGITQVKESIKTNKFLDGTTIIYCSDFKRTRETAYVVRYVLKSNQIHLTTKLRERFFGLWDTSSDKHYKNIWLEDNKNPDKQKNDVESTLQVQDRATKLIEELELKYKNKNILLVSHADCIQILMTGFLKIHPSKHREISHMHTAEIREIQLKE